MNAPVSVPVPVLEALASAWEDQAESAAGDSLRGQREGTAEGRDLYRWHAGECEALGHCARMLREAITEGSAG